MSVRKSSDQSGRYSVPRTRSRHKSEGVQAAAASVLEILEQRQLLSTVVFQDHYDTDTTANYVQTDQDTSGAQQDTWTVANGTLNYARTDTNSWNTSVFLLKPQVANTAGLLQFSVSGDLIAGGDTANPGLNFQPGLVISGDTTKGGFVVMEYDNGSLANHLVLLQESGGQLTGDEGGTGSPPVVADLGDVSNNINDTFHVVANVDRTGANPKFNIAVTDLTDSTFTLPSTTVTDTNVASTFGGTQVGWRARYDNTKNTATFSVDNLEIDNTVTNTTQPPAAPTNLAVASVNGITVTLTFNDNANNELGYSIERAPSNNGQPGTFTPIGNLGAQTGATATFVDSTGMPGTTYFYRVRAFNSVNNQAAYSAYAGPVSATTQTAGPGAEAHYFNQGYWSGPALNTVVANVNFDYGNGSPDPAIRADNFSTIFTGKIHVTQAGTYTFLSNTDDDGYLYVDGQLASSDPGGHGPRDANDPANMLGKVVPLTLTAGDYDFVLLQDEQGGGAAAHLDWIVPGATASAVIPQASLNSLSDPPAAPTGVTASNISSNSITFAFTDNSKSEVWNQLQRSLDGGRTWQTINQALVNSTMLDDAEPIPGSTAMYRVVAANFDGNAASTPISVTVAAQATANVPGVEAHYYSGEIATTPLDPTSFVANTAYALNASGFVGAAEYKLSSNGDTMTSTGPIDSDYGGGSPDPAGYPDIPRIGADDFATVWTGKIVAPETGTYTFVGNSDDDGYIYVNGQLVSSDPGGHGPQDATNVTPIDLVQGQAYDFLMIHQELGGGAAVHAQWVTPSNAGGTPAIIPAFDGTSGLEAISDVPTAPGNVAVNAIGSGGVTLSWTDTAKSEIYYEIERSTDGTNFSPIARVGFNHTTFTDATATDASATKVYSYRVRAVNYDGASAFGNADTGHPQLAAPTVAAQACDPGTISLLINDSSPSTAQYKIEQSTDGTTFTTAQTATANKSGSTIVAISGLDATKTYTFRVTAQGNGNGFADSTATTTAGVQPNNTAHVPVNYTPDFANNQGNLQLNQAAGSGGLPTFTTPTGGSGTALQLTPDAGNFASSAFTTTLEHVDSFDTTFNFEFAGAQAADGFTFTVQNAPAGDMAVGGGGGALGYQGITNSVAVKFDLWNGGPAATYTGVYTNGEAVTDAPVVTPGNPDPAPLHTSVDLSKNGLDFHANKGDVYSVHLAYDGKVLTETVTDTTLAAKPSVTIHYNIDIPSIVGGPCAFVGFTAGTGGATSEQDILSWTYTAPVAAQFNKADFNHSGKVDFADLLILAQNYGKTGVTNQQGDTNGDGKVDFSDLLFLAQNYNKTGPQAGKTKGSLLSDVVGLVKTH